MATVSGKLILPLMATTLVPVFINGCSSLMPAMQQESHRGVDKSPVETIAAVEKSQRELVRFDAAPLPRQAYSPSGEKLPYIQHPNPYTADVTTVPADARSTFVVASYLLRDGKLKDARTQFKKLTEKYPTLSGPWVKLAAIAEKREKYDEAANYYEKAIDVNENNVNAYIALGLLQRRQGQFTDAQNTYIKALNVWNDFPEAHLDLAILYDLYLNEPEAAQKHYEAYYFLTSERDEKVHKWLVEVRRRTGIEHSFIDIPPKETVEVPVEKPKNPSVATAAGTPG